MRVLVTGGTGFIGSHLAKRLLEKGHEVFALSKSPGDSRDAEGIDVRQGDISDASKIMEIVSEISPKKIFHLAASLGRNGEGDGAVIKTNVLGTLNLLEAAESAGVECFVNTGSAEEYGNGPVPFEESQKELPASVYAASKTCSNHICGLFHKHGRVPTVTLRPFIVYGPFQYPGMLIPSAIVSSIGGESMKTSGGKQTRDFVYVEDVADAYVRASENKKALGETINICSGRETRIADVLKMISDLVGGGDNLDIGGLPYRKGEIWRYFGDNSKARKLLGWEPKTSLEEGLRKTVEWYKSNIGKLG